MPAYLLAERQTEAPRALRSGKDLLIDAAYGIDHPASGKQGLEAALSIAT
jgi:hypothetical protein